MFKNNAIRKRVMEVIDQKIEEAQKAHDAEREELLQAFEKDLEEIHAKHMAKKEELLDTHVQKILGKIL